MAQDDRHAFGQNFRWDEHNGAWKTTGSPNLVWVVPPSEYVPYWWIRTEPDGVHRQFEGNVAEWQAFHDAAKLAQKVSKQAEEAAR